MMHLLRKYDVAPLRSASDTMFAIKCGEATHHSRSEHHQAQPSSFAEGKHHSKNAPLSVDKSAFFVGGNSRARNLRLDLPRASLATAKRFFVSFNSPCSLCVLRRFSLLLTNEKGLLAESFFIALNVIKGQLEQVKLKKRSNLMIMTVLFIVILFTVIHLVL